MLQFWDTWLRQTIKENITIIQAWIWYPSLAMMSEYLKSHFYKKHNSILLSGYVTMITFPEFHSVGTLWVFYARINVTPVASCSWSAVLSTLLLSSPVSRPDTSHSAASQWPNSPIRTGAPSRGCAGTIHAPSHYQLVPVWTKPFTGFTSNRLFRCSQPPVGHSLVPACSKPFADSSLQEIICWSQPLVNPFAGPNLQKTIHWSPPDVKLSIHLCVRVRAYSALASASLIDSVLF